MSTERERLSDLIAANSMGIGRTVEQDHALADALIADGWHRNRVVSTVEELDALPNGVVVKDYDGDVFERAGRWEWTTSPDALESRDLVLPVTVLYEPGGQP